MASNFNLDLLSKNAWGLICWILFLTVVGFFFFTLTSSIFVLKDKFLKFKPEEFFEVFGTKGLTMLSLSLAEDYLIYFEIEGFSEG